MFLLESLHYPNFQLKVEVYTFEVKVKSILLSLINIQAILVKISFIVGSMTQVVKIVTIKKLVYLKNFQNLSY